MAFNQNEIKSNLIKSTIMMEVSDDDNDEKELWKKEIQKLKKENVTMANVYSSCRFIEAKGQHRTAATEP